MDGTLDYKSYFEQFQLSWSGLVPNVRGGEPDVNHSWRFIAREEPCPLTRQSKITILHIVCLFVLLSLFFKYYIINRFLYPNTPIPLPVELGCYPNGIDHCHVDQDLPSLDRENDEPWTPDELPEEWCQTNRHKIIGWLTSI
jgi:hypothetical protein